ncbi:CAP domain-containing protein [Plantactinospora sonchi]|uniref:CAP domain-containing protein n=1 Tax=Plantactinospora sonchi TaxID=1544735 RepID=A0ABU7RWL6_9ACTN
MHGWNDPIDRGEGTGWPSPPDRGHPSDPGPRQPSDGGQWHTGDQYRQPSGDGDWANSGNEHWDDSGDRHWDSPGDRHREYPGGGGWADSGDRHPTELGFFELGPDQDDEVPARRVRPGATAGPARIRPDSRDGGRRPDDGRAESRNSGRHRRQTRLRGPVGLGVAVTALLALIGVGAALLPPALTSAPSISGAEQPAPDTAAEPSDGTSLPEAPQTDVDADTASPSPVPSSTRPSPKPSATPRTTRPRTTSPTPRRTTAKAPTRANPSEDSREAQVLEIVNRERAANGCDPVVMNRQLAEAARLHSQDQGEHTNMSHTGSDGSSFVERARRAGYDNPIGENVAMGYPNAAAVMDGWMNSSGHRANILNCAARAMGVGVATGADGRLYWTQVFGATA